MFSLLARVSGWFLGVSRWGDVTWSDRNHIVKCKIWTEDNRAADKQTRCVRTTIAYVFKIYFYTTMFLSNELALGSPYTDNKHLLMHFPAKKRLQQAPKRSMSDSHGLAGLQLLRIDKCSFPQCPFSVENNQSDFIQVLQSFRVSSHDRPMYKYPHAGKVLLTIRLDLELSKIVFSVRSHSPRSVSGKNKKYIVPYAICHRG